MWVTRGSLVSPERVAAMVRSAAASGFNTLLVQVRGRGDAYFASRVEPRAEALAGQPASFDPLAATLALARAQGLRVHAWVNVNLTSSGAELPASREHVVYEHPEWLMVPRALAFELGRDRSAQPGVRGPAGTMDTIGADRSGGTLLVAGACGSRRSARRGGRRARVRTTRWTGCTSITRGIRRRRSITAVAHSARSARRSTAS